MNVSISISMIKAIIIHIILRNNVFLHTHYEKHILLIDTVSGLFIVADNMATYKPQTKLFLKRLLRLFPQIPHCLIFGP